MISPRISTVILFGLSLSLSARAADVTGQFVAGSRKPIRPMYAAAFDERDQRDPHKRVVAVVLSDSPVDTAAAVADLDPHTNIINQPNIFGHNYVLLWVRPGGDVSMNATYAEKMTQFLDTTSDGLKAEMTANTADRVAGRIFTAKPVKTMSGETYSMNITFAADVVHAPASTKLPANGGPAGAAFAALMSGITAKSWPAISQHVTDKNLKMFVESDRTEKENLADAIQTLGFWLPKKTATVTGGELRGDTAILEVEGDSFAGKSLYLVRMVKTGPNWLFDRATNAGSISN